MNNSSLKEQVPFYALLVLCFFPIMPYGIMSAAIILFAFLCIVVNYKDLRNNHKKVGLLPLLMNIGFFLFLALTLAYSENLNFGWRQIERGLPLLLFPIVFMYFPPKLSKKKWQIVLATFVLANLLFVIFLYIYLVGNASDFRVPERDGLILFEGLKNKSFILQLRDLWNGTFYEILYYAKRNTESFLEIHKTYAAQNIIWCMVIVAFFSMKKRLSPLKKIAQLLLLIILGLVLVYLYSLMNLFLLLLLSPLLIYAVLGLAKHRVWLMIGSLALVVAIFFMGSFGRTMSSDPYEKYQQHENPLYVLSNIEKMLQKDERNTINECNTTLIMESPFLGFGVGDVQDLLNSCYTSLEGEIKDAPNIKEQNLNSHNYYAFLGLAGGLIALLLFLGMIVYNTSIGIRKKDFLYLAFILIVAMNLITENTLGRAQGVLFFALFNSILLSKNRSLGEDVF